MTYYLPCVRGKDDVSMRGVRRIIPGQDIVTITITIITNKQDYQRRIVLGQYTVTITITITSNFLLAQQANKQAYQRWSYSTVTIWNNMSPR